MEFFNINLGVIMFRFYLMMAVIVLGVFTGQVWLTVLGLPIFLSAVLGVSLKHSATIEKPVATSRQVQNKGRQAA